MSFQDLNQTAKKYFPDLQIKYKDQSSLMKTLGTIMFFNKGFMTNYTTTLGATVYFPNETFVRARPVSAAVILLHELVHVTDAHKFSKPLFGFLYMSPQALALLCLPLFLFHWYLALPLFLLCASPIPSFFRMYFEKRAYMTSLYAINALGNRLNFKPLLDTQKQFFLDQFKGPNYYFMWPFNNLQKDFDQAVVKIQAGERPFEDPVFNILDELIATV